MPCFTASLQFITLYWMEYSLENDIFVLSHFLPHDLLLLLLLRFSVRIGLWGTAASPPQNEAIIMTTAGFKKAC